MWVGFGEGELTFPAMKPHQSQPTLKAISVHSQRGEDEIQQGIVEKGLERRHRSSLVL